MLTKEAPEGRFFCYNIQMKRGFTLIELLVVISIIALLSSIVLASINTAREKARDAKRLADIRSIQSALTQYKLDNGVFPTVGGAWASNCSNSSAYLTQWNSTLAGKLAPYLTELPDDPSGDTWPVCYYYKIGGYSYCDQVNPEYTLIFTLESTRPASLENSINIYNSQSGVPAGGRRYCIHEL